MLTLAFAPHRAWFLVWVGFVPMIVAQHRVLPERLSALAPGIAVGGFIAGCFGGVFPERAAWYMKALPLLVGVVVLLASLGDRARYQRTGYRFWPLFGAISWVAIELVRSLIPARSGRGGSSATRSSGRRGFCSPSRCSARSASISSSCS